MLGLPDIRAATAKTQGLETHGIHGHIACQNEQVSPRELAAIFLLDRPEQAARFIEVAVVRPTVERGKALRARARAASAIADAVGSGGMPCHAYEKGAVVAIVGGPPVLRISHQGGEVFHHGIQIEGFEFTGVIKIRRHRAGHIGLLMQDAQLELLGPPCGIGHPTRHSILADAMRKRALAWVDGRR